jgi:ubiquinone/menaquinone biosynthesis C-methylase UbiE
VLESPERRRTQDPGALFRRIGLRRGQTLVEVGAGTGYFSVPAARTVGPTGKVYAVDLSEDLVRLLRERRTRERLPQLQPVVSTVTAIPLPSGIADAVLLANVLHDLPAPTVAEAARLLRPRGRFVNVDWRRIRSPGGPPSSVRLAPAKAERVLARYGLRVVDRWRFGPWHYGLTLTRAPRSVKRGSSVP